MPRKGENIYKRKDGRWEGRYIGCYDENHKAKYVYIYGKTYTEVKQKLAIERGRQKQHVPAEKKQITYGEVLDLWLHSTKTSIKESTYARYAHLINSHIKPQLGDYKLSMLSTEIIENFIENQLVEGQLDRTGGLAPKTVIDLLAIVKSTIGYAQYKGFPVICNLSRLSVKRKDKEMRVLTPSERESLIGILMEDMDSFKFGVFLALYTGIRIGELCALQWKDIDFARATLKVRKTIQRIQNIDRQAVSKTKIVISEPKSKCSIREIPLSVSVMDIAQNFISYPESYVLTGTSRYIEPRTMQNHFKLYASTIGEVLYESTIMEHSNDERNSSINKHLFESIGEAPNFDVPKVTPAAPAVQKDETDHKTKASGKQTVNSVRVVDVVPPVINEPDKTAAVDKKEIGKVVFSVPVIIFLIGVIAFFIVVPNIYGNTVSFIDWMISDPQNIIDTLRDSNVVLPKVYGIIGIKFFWWVWLACLIASLFFVGRQLHAKPEPNAANTILTKREPYLMMQDVYDALKSLKARTNDKRLDMVLYAAKRVKEKLSVESDFGYGKDIVINCENNIAKQLQFLLDIIPVADNGNIEENMKAINTAISNINSLLRKRTELKRR